MKIQNHFSRKAIALFLARRGRALRRAKAGILKEVRFYTILLLVSIVLASAMRIFLFASFKIPSPSMEPAVLAGDYLVINKQIPGPRVYPHFPKAAIDGKVVTKRYRGIRPVRRNDILVFNFPYANSRDKLEMNIGLNYLKRCVAIPGDTFYIENGIYKVKNISDSLGYLFRQKELAVRPIEDFRPEIRNTFPGDTIRYRWNIKDFGPLYVPKKGDSLSIDTLNYILYKNLITYETDKPLKIHDGKIQLGDSTITGYTFQMNYYFMAGDFIFDSVDSRYWGLLPEDHIIGKAILVWKSKDMHTGKTRWNRIFKTL